MKQYLDFMRHVRRSGAPKADRTGTGTLSVFGYQMRFDLAAAELNAYYGNQKGRRRLDLDGLSAIGLQVLGGQGEGTLKVESLTLE
jgi:hypothetical protein